MVTEKDLKIGVEWSYNDAKYIFITNPNGNHIDFKGINSMFKYEQYSIELLLKYFNDGTYIIYKPKEKIYETW